jgi:DNA-binding transcriptional regulator PaaX
MTTRRPRVNCDRTRLYRRRNRRRLRAGISALTEGGLLVVHKQGRHSYFRLASLLIGQMLEGIMAVAAEGPAPRNRPRWRGDEALRLARTVLRQQC